MLIAESYFQDMIDSPARSIKARVELLEGSTLLQTFSHGDHLKEFTISREGDSTKVFGYGICQKLEVKLLDKDREINILKGQKLEVAIGVESDYLYTCPVFFVDDVKRDENTNELTVVAYDALYVATAHTVSEIDVFGSSYNIKAFATSCAKVLGMPVKYENMADECFCLEYPTGANFNGSETIRDALNAVAEATQTIYYMNNNWELTFKRLDVTGAAVHTIQKSRYFTLSSKTDVVIGAITHTTELGDNVTAKSEIITGMTHFIRNNPFWELLENPDAEVIKALAAVEGLTLNQFDCSWRGNFLLEIGDKIALITKDNVIVHSYLLNDVITYNGGFKEKTSWSFTENQSEQVTSNPATIGETVRQTYAKVDRANNRIDMVADDVTALSMSASGITASVSKIEESINTLEKKVEASMTAEEVEIKISTAISEKEQEGVNSVTTTTGFTFDHAGLTIAKSGTEMKTTVSEDGMTVYRDNNAVLVANNEGVQAEDLHATTYLIIGKHSLLQDYKTIAGSGRTGCFWITD
jgi:hypothetical protein